MAKRPTKDPKFAELKQNIDLEQFAASVKGAFLEADDPRQISKIKYPFLKFGTIFQVAKGQPKSSQDGLEVTG